MPVPVTMDSECRDPPSRPAYEIASVTGTPVAVLTATATQSHRQDSEINSTDFANSSLARSLSLRSQRRFVGGGTESVSQFSLVSSSVRQAKRVLVDATLTLHALNGNSADVAIVLPDSKDDT